MGSLVTTTCDGSLQTELGQTTFPTSYNKVFAPELLEQVCSLPPANTPTDLPRLGLRQGEMSPVNKTQSRASSSQEVFSPEFAEQRCPPNPAKKLMAFQWLDSSKAEMLPVNKTLVSLPALPREDESPFLAHESLVGSSLVWLQMPLPIDTSSDNSPLATSERLPALSKCGDSWPVSSYAECSVPLRQRSRHVTFASSPTHSVHRSEFAVEPYSEVYGMHPRDFDFDMFGQMVSRGESSTELQSDSGEDEDAVDTFDLASFAEWGAKVHRPIVALAQPYLSYGRYDFRNSTSSADFLSGFSQQSWNAPFAA